MPNPIKYQPVHVPTRADIPNPPTPGTEYWIADEGVIAVALPNGILEEYGNPGAITPGTTNYNALSNKPVLNGVVLSGDLTAAQLSLASEVVYEHDQTAPSTTWNIQHNLGKKYVNILLLDENDVGIVGEEDWALSTNNLLVVHFSEALLGKAIIK
jgi:hypothetical protein